MKFSLFRRAYRPIAEFPAEDFSGSGSDRAARFTYADWTVSAVPVPAAVWLFGTALLGLVGFGKIRKNAQA